MDDIKWFGKGCKYLSAKWEENEITAGLEYKKSEPILKFCNHPDNKENCEGNCRENLCPLLSDKNE